MDPKITVKELSLSLPDSSSILKNVSLQIPAGEITLNAMWRIKKTFRTSEANWERLMVINLKGPVRVCKYGVRSR